ncbi:MAG TPA: helix-turn-helix transcriptional regulator [Bacteroidales bacterium]|nr:helix-turn-helix transcriptional regulator [Bacteroidales bacterium]
MLGEKIKLIREEMGMSQRELGGFIEVDAAFISKVEKGEKPINRNHLKKISQILKVKQSYLQTLWLADKVYKLVAEEDFGTDALHLAEQKIEYQKKKRP